MFVSANTYDTAKNKWVNQQIHKIHNQTQYASKHYVNYANGIYPINQRKYRKKLEHYFQRQTIYKQTAFDYDDFLFQNKNENYKRIQIRPTIHYNHAAEWNIVDLCDQFYGKYHSNPFNPVHTKKKMKNINAVRSYQEWKSGTKILENTTADTDTNTATNKNKNAVMIKPYQATKKKDPFICPQCNIDYDSYKSQCAYCVNQRWLQSLFAGIAVDIFDNENKRWYVGTITKVLKTKTQLYVLVHYNGFKSRYEWVQFNFAATTAMDKDKVTKLNKIKKVHTVTPHHHYEYNTHSDSTQCTARKYKKCVLCDVKYCKICMNVDINKYNQCNKCLKLIEKNKWLTEVKEDDKMDVYLYGYRGAKYNHQWYCGWHIATVIQVKQTGKSENKFKLFVSFDGLESTSAEWIDVDICSKLLGNKLKRLNKMTFLHSYLLADNKNIAVCVEKDKWEKCIVCRRTFCVCCVVGGIVIDGVGYKCFKCGVRQENKNLFRIIKQSLLGTLIHMNIIYNIYQYSQGITVRCCNQMKNCQNEINFDTTFEMEVNAQQNTRESLEVYQYYLYKNQTTNTSPNVRVYLCNRKRRIFCAGCSKHELIKCVLCNKAKEVKASFQCGYNTYKCQHCVELIINEQQRKRKELKTVKEETKKDSFDKVVMNKYVDVSFKKFKDLVVPEIVLKKSKTKQNIKYVRKVLGKHGINVSELPYNIWSMECNLMPNCYRKYCAFYHNAEEKELGRVISMLFEQRKFEQRIVKSRYYVMRCNEHLMDYDFHLKYLVLRRGKLRKFNVQRKTKKKMKRKAYFLRKEDKECNAKQNKKFKTRYCLQLFY